MRNPSSLPYLIYYMEVAEIKDVDAFLKALNNIESLARYKYSDPWTEEDLSKKYVCVNVKDYQVRGCYRTNNRPSGLPLTPYDPNELDNFMPVLELKRLTET